MPRKDLPSPRPRPHAQFRLLPVPMPRAPEWNERVARWAAA